MKKDPLITRIRAKLNKTARTLTWQYWLLKNQCEDKSNRSFCNLLGVSSIKDGSRKLKNQNLPKLIAEDTLFGLAPKVNHKHLLNFIRIFGRNYPLNQLDENWHSDWINGGYWELDWHWRLSKVKGDGSDVKVPWEVSRFHFLPKWAFIYKKTKQPEIAKLFINTVNSWIKRNPIGIGINWTCAMEVAIRAANWIITWPIFSGAPEVNESFVWKFFKCLYAHGLFIQKNIEGPGWYANNHYLANLAGLIFIGAGCPAFRNKSLFWIECGKIGLEREIYHQVLPDGVCFEESTCYHLFSLEIFFYAFIMAEAANKPFSEKYKQKLKSMFAALGKWIKPSGNFTQVGDNDSGRFLGLYKGSISDHRYLYDLGTSFFNLPRIEDNNFQSKQSLPILKVRKSPNRSNTSNCLNSSCFSFPHAGWQILQKGQWWVFAICGNQSYHCEGGHAHSDRLSFELCYKNQDVLVDPGSYVYTANPEERRMFKSTRYHNILNFGPLKENFSGDIRIFNDPRPQSGNLLKFQENNKSVMWMASASKELPFWIRTLTVEFDKFVVTDELAEKTEVYGTLNFHPTIKVVLKDDKPLCVELKLKDRKSSLFADFFGIFDLKIVKSWYSPEYSLKEPSSQIRYKIKDRISGFTIRE